MQPELRQLRAFLAVADQEIDAEATEARAEPAPTIAARYVRGCRPVVLTGHTRDWAAMRNWSPEDLKRRFGHLDVDIQSERNADPNYEQNKLTLAKRVKLGGFVDRVVQGGILIGEICPLLHSAVVRIGGP